MDGLVPDAGAFLERLTRLDRRALVRTRSLDAPGEAGRALAQLWARVPWDVLVTRTVAGFDAGGQARPFDITVSASAWLARPDAALSALPRLDAAWRSALPGGVGRVRETIDSQVVRDLAAAAAATMRAAQGGALASRSVGERAIRDALLDHAALVIESDGDRIEVPQRMIQAVIQMGFLDLDSAVRIRTSGPWLGVCAAYGAAWRRDQNVEITTLLPIPSRL